MGKRGFTLIELLGVIVLLGVVMVIAFTSIGGVTRKLQENMLDEKITLIEEAAKLRGQDIKGSIINSTQTYDGYPCRSIIVSDLVTSIDNSSSKYLSKDNNNVCLTKDSTETVGCIEDPSNKDNYLDKLEVIIYYRNRRIYAVVDRDNNLTCS